MFPSFGKTNTAPLQQQLSHRPVPHPAGQEPLGRTLKVYTTLGKRIWPAFSCRHVSSLFFRMFKRAFAIKWIYSLLSPSGHRGQEIYRNEKYRANYQPGSRGRAVMCSSQTPPQTHQPASIIIYHLVSSYFITKRQKKRATDSTCSGFRDTPIYFNTLLGPCCE